IVDLMVEKLFRQRRPESGSTVLDPGCGTGAFVDGIVRWCRSHGNALPRIVGIESDPVHYAVAAGKFESIPGVEIRRADFLTDPCEKFDYIIGNPPYVSILGLTEEERRLYKRLFTTATNRFDLYILFFERALSALRPCGRLVFITPEKYIFVDSAAALRRLMSGHAVEELHYISEDSFRDLVTYPLVTTIDGDGRPRATRVVRRDGTIGAVSLERTTSSWLPQLMGVSESYQGPTLSDLCTRISCGIATGADGVFVLPTRSLDPELRTFAYPTIAGREIQCGRMIPPTRSILVPYDRTGGLLPENQLGRLGEFLSLRENKQRLMARSCARSKPWYSFHENPAMEDLLAPKLMCKDIGFSPFFVRPTSFEVIPRHSVYYLVPRSSVDIDHLCAYLNSASAQRWLQSHCQRASRDFIRMQSGVLRRLPVALSSTALGNCDPQAPEAQTALTI
ncbi:MAG TPA: Eco57I restriction-modification methylase domain-containing protein, partial [Chthonomonadaceae bacterium]|nr:Eco57I restriction-modification methylase domain-containing protein [Chthonomonadaceae bacterium]